MRLAITSLAFSVMLAAAADAAIVYHDAGKLVGSDEVVVPVFRDTPATRYILTIRSSSPMALRSIYQAGYFIQTYTEDGSFDWWAWDHYTTRRTTALDGFYRQNLDTSTYSMNIDYWPSGSVKQTFERWEYLRANHLRNDVPYSDHTGRYSIYIQSRSLAVPEPGTWALLVSGFGLVGTALRRRRAVCRG